MAKQQSCSLTVRIKTNPDIFATTNDAHLFGAQLERVAAGNLGHRSRVAPAFKKQISGAGFVSHAFQLPIHNAAADQTGLGAAIQHLLNSVKRGVIYAIAESHAESASGGHELYRQHAEALEQPVGQKALTAGIARRFPGKHGTSPLQSERGSDLLFGDKSQLRQPLPDALVGAALLGFESRSQLLTGKLPAGKHE